MKLFTWYKYGPNPLLPYMQNSRGLLAFFWDAVNSHWLYIHLLAKEYEIWPLEILEKNSSFFKAHGHDSGIIKAIFEFKPEAFKL